MGQATEVAHGAIDGAFDPTTGCALDSSISTLTAAKGDRAYLPTTGKLCQTSPTTFHETGAYKITGGTGRFSDASGGGANATLGAFTSATSGAAVKSYEGTISSPSAIREPHEQPPYRDAASSRGNG